MSIDCFPISSCIQIAADDVAHLRRCDVYRVLAAYPTRRTELGEYIATHRPELLAAVDAANDAIDIESADFPAD